MMRNKITELQTEKEAGMVMGVSVFIGFFFFTLFILLRLYSRRMEVVSSPNVALSEYTTRNLTSFGILSSLPHAELP